jgi:hypothetical protein
MENELQSFPGLKELLSAGYPVVHLIETVSGRMFAMALRVDIWLA